MRVVLSEGFHLLGAQGAPALIALLRRHALTIGFDLRGEKPRVFELMHKYRTLRMGVADACLVRMSERLADPLLLTTDEDFRVYRRHGRHVIPAALP